MSETLEAVPLGLQDASGILQSCSQQLVAANRPAEPATESAGLAALTLTNAFERFGTVFGHRLSFVSTQLGRAAEAYTSMDVGNSQAVQVA